MRSLKAAPPAASRTRSRLSLLLLLALFASPVVLAWLALYVFPEWQPARTVNHGQLIKPLRPFPAVRMQAISGDTIDETYLRGKWTLVYLRQGPCAEQCVRQLYNLRQVRLAQGKNIDRVQRLMLWDAVGVGPEQRAELADHFPGQAIAVPTDRAAAVVLELFALDEQDPMRAGRVYLIDPLGNLMMSYGPGDEPRGMIEDLERLLKYSGLG
jgi:cytochrome oxidase Cu insertion factor (SCO1/SenC/PrrC family)